jgi:hypothetical protein
MIPHPDAEDDLRRFIWCSLAWLAAGGLIAAAVLFLVWAMVVGCT